MSEDNFTALLRFPGGAYAVVTETLAGFEYHHATEVVGTRGRHPRPGGRARWTARASPRFELKVKRRGGRAPRPSPSPRSGELFELETQLAQAVAAFRERRPLVSGEEARKRVVVCVEAERSLREGREVPLAFSTLSGILPRAQARCRPHSPTRRARSQEFRIVAMWHSRCWAPSAESTVAHPSSEQEASHGDRSSEARRAPRPRRRGHRRKLPCRARGHRRQARALPRPARSRADHPRGPGQAHGTPTSGTCASGSRRWPPAATSPTTAPPSGSPSRKSRPSRS